MIDYLAKDLIDRRRHCVEFQRLVCVHEAGHALVAQALGWVPTCMVLHRGANTGQNYGETFVVAPGETAVCPIVQIAFLYAGALAVSMTGAGGPWGASHGAQHDHYTAMAVAVDMGLDEDDLLRAISAADEALRSNRPQLEALAEALYAEGVLDWSEIATALEGVA